MYDPKSRVAEEFICHEEILDTLAYAEEHKHDRPLIDSLLEKAAAFRGLTHREAAVLLACDLEDVNQKILDTAVRVKEHIYGTRIVLFAPLYLSNYCVNTCTYCPYHAKNKHIQRKKLTQEEIEREVIALQDLGHKRLLLEAGEHQKYNPIEYILESIKTIYSIKHKNGAIRRLNVNIAATTVENYRKLHEAQIGTYQLFQETYHKESYKLLHPKGPKSDYAYHTEAHDRAMEGGIDDVGLGVLFGLEHCQYDFVGLLMHAEHLEAVWGVGPHTISVPRICPADDIDPNTFSNAVPDDLFLKIWENRETLQDVRSFKNYLFRMTKNAIFDRFEHKAVDARYQQTSQAVDLSELVSDDIAARIDQKDLLLLIELAVDKMPPQRQRIFRMSRIDGIPQPEIARQLGISLKTVEYHIHEALAELRKLIQVLILFI